MAITTVLLTLIVAFVIVACTATVITEGLLFLLAGLCAFNAKVKDALFILSCYLIISNNLFGNDVLNVLFCIIVFAILVFLKKLEFRIILKNVAFLMICYFIFKNFIYAIFNTSLIHIGYCIALYVLLQILFVFTEN